MYLTGFADEASQDIDLQIQATKELGWDAIESRNVNGKNIHDLPEDEFNIVANKLDEAGIRINCFGSAIGNWAKNIHDPFDITLKEVERAIPRMQRLGTKLIRIMSYARCEGVEQYADERIRRLNDIVPRFLEHGIQPVHENCMNYGGMSWQHSLELVNNVPGLKLIYDTGNSPFMRDYAKKDYAKKSYAKPDGAQKETQWQDGWEFYNQVKPYIAYIHIKDSRSPEPGEKETYTMPGEGHGHVTAILQDLKNSGYDGGISIEPHLASVFHDPASVNTANDKSYELYITYGRRLMALLDEIGYPHHLYSEQINKSS